MRDIQLIATLFRFNYVTKNVAVCRQTYRGPIFFQVRQMFYLESMFLLLVSPH